MKHITVLIFLLSVCLDAYACRFAHYDQFPPQNPSLEAKGVKPQKPQATFEVTRGNPDSIDSCSDTATIKIEIPSDGYSRSSTGYLFEVVSSTVDQRIFPKYAVYGASFDVEKTNTFVFPWVDGRSYPQGHVEIVVKVYRVSDKWVLSEPVALEIKSYGRI